jgi:hypothetical protein
MEIAGLPVRNGMKQIKLNITKDDVKKGKGLDPGACAAAVCLIREGYADYARVHISVTYFRKSDWKYWYRLETPESLQRELISLDRNGEFVPSEHILRPIRPSHQSSGHRQGGPTVSGQTKTKLNKKRPRPYHVTKKVREFGANR